MENRRGNKSEALQWIQSIPVSPYCVSGPPGTHTSKRSHACMRSTHSIDPSDPFHPLMDGQCYKLPAMWVDS